MLKAIVFCFFIQGILGLGAFSKVLAEQVPLQFDLVGQGPVDLVGPYLDYALSEDGLKLGNMLFNEKTVRVSMAQVDGTRENQLVISKPAGWLPGQVTFELRDLSGEVVWTQAHPGSKESVINLPFKPRSLPPRPLKLFLTATSGMNNLVLSLGEYEWRADRIGNWVMTMVTRPRAPLKVMLGGQVVATEGRYQVPPEGLSFFADLGTGRTLQVFAVPEPMPIHDMVEFKRGIVRITSHGTPPLGKVLYPDKDELSFLTEFFKWQQTIGDFREFWQMDLPVNAPTFYRPGLFGEVYRYDFVIRALPREGERVFLDAGSPRGTYANNAKLFGTVPRLLQIDSSENSLRKDNDGDFVWRFRAEERGAVNRARLVIERRGHRFPMSYELYKGFPRELSARLSGVYGSNDALLFVGEGAFNYWFEDLLGWNNYYLGRHRWGLSLKGFRSLNALRVDTRSGAIQYLTADVKYRLTPGLWGRDESWGLIFGNQRVKFNLFQSDQQGYGLFWARSMPRLFDEWINLLPLMNYPKWVDLELIYYPTLKGTDVEARNPPSGAGNWSLNFHGKVLWTDRLFGEAGFGVKQLNWRQKRLEFRFTSFYLTAGLGVNF